MTDVQKATTALQQRYETGELKEALTLARQNSDGLNIKEKTRVLHSVLDEMPGKRTII